MMCHRNGQGVHTLDHSPGLLHGLALLLHEFVFELHVPTCCSEGGS